jgi:tRNA dimethylallyltransferase
MERGLIGEVEGLLERGYSLDLPAMSGLGYKQIGRFIRGEKGLEEAVQQIKYDTHRFARHQYAWFRPSNESIRWFDVRDEGKLRHNVQRLISEFTGNEPAKQLSRLRA